MRRSGATHRDAWVYGLFGGLWYTRQALLETEILHSMIAMTSAVCVVIVCTARDCTRPSKYRAPWVTIVRFLPQNVLVCNRL